MISYHNNDNSNNRLIDIKLHLNAFKQPFAGLFRISFGILQWNSVKLGPWQFGGNNGLHSSTTESEINGIFWKTEIFRVYLLANGLNKEMFSKGKTLTFIFVATSQSAMEVTSTVP